MLWLCYEIALWSLNLMSIMLRCGSLGCGRLVCNGGYMRSGVVEVLSLVVITHLDLESRVLLSVEELVLLFTLKGLA